jgi:probable O-glycosylation ligase (exosortase A-associated)
MNPQKISYGALSNLPYALIVAVVTLIAWFFSREPKMPPKDSTGVLLCLLMVWVTITSAFALTPAFSVWDRWLLCEKMFLMTVLTYTLTTTRERLEQLIAVCAISIGFVGFAGGIFTIANGGNFRVYGPGESTIGDNNDFGVALVTMLPLLFYIFQRINRWYLKWPFAVVLALNFLATLFTYSRGALVAITIMGGTFWFRARVAHKIIFAVLFVVAISAVLQYAPPEWLERMGTIETYKDDQSAESRLYFWQLAWAMALHHPVMGAGYRWMYFPNIVNSTLADSGLPALERPRAIHSIWFEMLGNHGFVGLGLFVGLFLTGLVSAAWIVRNTKGNPAMRWADDLGRALQASLIGFAAGGTFVSLEMWDGFYVVVVMAAAARAIVARELSKKPLPDGVPTLQKRQTSLPVARPATI